MMKKVTKILLFIFSISFCISSINATSLKDLKDQLKKDEANQAKLIAEQKKVQKKLNKAKQEITEIYEEIEQYEKDIENAKAKIVILNSEIVKKNTEIDSLLSFLQVSDGDNVYLEYIFGASDYTDFIYRSAIVEQLTEYNDKLIDDMYKMIEENKQLQVDLAKKIDESESATQKLNKVIKSYNLTMDDIDEDQIDIAADIKARKKEIEYYEAAFKKKSCDEDQDIYDCIGVPYSSSFTRPVNSGSITSNYGWRYHPTLHYYRMHNGMDIGVGMGTNVYASAAGVVNKIVRKSSCGGNMVYIQHNVDGKRYRTVYMHLHTVKVKVGSVVTMMSVIGTSGGGESYDNCSTGPHLHFGIMTNWFNGEYVNPRNYVSFPAKGKRFKTRF